jgi:hypothetical protein
MSISSTQDNSPKTSAPAHSSPYVHAEEAGKPKQKKKVNLVAGIIVVLLVSVFAVNGWMNRNETGTGKEVNPANTLDEAVHSQKTSSDATVFIDQKSSRMAKIQQINNRIDSLRQLIQFQANEIDRCLFRLTNNVKRLDGFICIHGDHRV